MFHKNLSPPAQKGKSKDLLDLEEKSSNSSTSSIQSKLLFCKKDDDFLLSTYTKSESVSILDKKPNICAIPESNVLGKVKHFLGVISESNKRLQFDSMENFEKYDVEVLNGDDLHTPESAIASYQPTVSFAAGSSCDDDDTDNDDSGDDDDSDGNHDEKKTTKASRENGNFSSEALRNQASKK